MASKAAGADAPLTIDVWADVLCPWCYVGEEHLSRAIEQSGRADSIELKIHTFQLDPAAPKTVMPTLDYLAKKYGAPPAQARAMEQGMAQKANALGLKYEVDRPASNTLDMLRLIHLAADYGVAWQYLRAMQAQVFEGNRDAFEHASLVRLGESLGIPGAEIQDVMATGRYAEAVRKDHETAVSLGANGVPFTVLGQRLAVRGAVGVEDYVAAIAQAQGHANG